MRYFICLTFLFLNALLLNAQEVAGTYELKVSSDESNTFKLVRTLQLNPDGTFEYYNFRFVEKGIPQETHTYGKGSWKQVKNIIVFSTNSTEIDDTYTLNFTGTKARFISKSPRDKSDRIIPTSLRFYESDIFWVTGMTLVKK